MKQVESASSITDEIINQYSEKSIKQYDSNEEERLRIEAAKAKLKELSKKSLSFPIEAFPEKLKNIIEVFNNCYGLPVDFYSGAMLTAASTLIGNAYVVEWKHEWYHAPIMYTAIVGKPGTGKTPAIKSMLAPLFKKEKDFHQKHTKEIQKWEEKSFRHSKKSGKKKPPKRPVRQELIINDATIEAITKSLSNNPRGLLLYMDEINAWLSGMNKYKSGGKGSDNEFWLSNWSSSPVKVNRTSQDPAYLDNSYINVIGGIQPGILKEMIAGGKGASGFLARVLFCFPDIMKKPYDNDQYPDHSVYETYNNILLTLEKLPHKIIPPVIDEDGWIEEGWVVESIKVKLTDDARVLYKVWKKENTDMINKADDEIMESIYTKMENYCLRFALILQLLDSCCGDYQIKTIEDAEKIKIEESTITNAIKITEYFKKTAFKVIVRFDSPVNQLPITQQALYEALPDVVKTAHAVQIGEKEFGLSARTVKNLLYNTAIFDKAKGSALYQKKYD